MVFNFWNDCHDQRRSAYTRAFTKVVVNYDTNHSIITSNACIKSNIGNMVQVNDPRHENVGHNIRRNQDNESNTYNQSK